MGEEINKTKPRILVAEDDKENQKYLDIILRRTYEIDFCDSPDDFFMLISSKKYNIIIMDITLKGEQSGLSLISKLKRKRNIVRYQSLDYLGMFLVRIGKKHLKQVRMFILQNQSGIRN